MNPLSITQAMLTETIPLRSELGESNFPTVVSHKNLSYLISSNMNRSKSRIKLFLSTSSRQISVKSIKQRAS